MLEVSFFNVGDGDAILIRERCEKDYVMLVDCGRPCLEFVPGSLREEAIYHLKREGIDHIDKLVLTHLHIDHIGGAMNILRHYPVYELEALYLPPEDRQWITPPKSDKKAIVGLCHMLNLLGDIVDAAGKCTRASAGSVMLTDMLGMQMFLPDAALIARQKALFDSLYHGGTPEQDEWFDISKERNISSLIMRLTYAGRSFLLTGDSYASYWQDMDIPKCDVVKLPHHGDEKSMTPQLIKRLAPSYAVASCQNDTSAKKDRPNSDVISFVQETVPTVICTENKPLRTLEAAAHTSVRFTVSPDGKLEMFA